MPLITIASLSSYNIDYVIVGGGTAGLTLAARLTENSDVVVLVIEAGLYHGSLPEIDTPGYIGRTIANPKFDWTFVSVPQVHANGRSILQPRGKGLGGSSMNNFLGVFRPHRDEVDAIQNLGNSGWNWDSFLYYVKKSETMLPSTLSPIDAKKYAADPDPEFHGIDGPIKKSFSVIFGEMQAKFFDAVENLGIPRNPDSSNGRNTGSMTPFMSVDSNTAKRSYSVSGYLEPNLGRKNLLVLPETYVTKVLFEDDQGSLIRASGVKFSNNGAVSTVSVNREVILAAGSLQTPQILELSGIGNAQILSKHGIKTLVDLPGVGENLQDHVGVSTVAEVETQDETMDVLQDPAAVERHEELYKQRTGLFANVPPGGFVFIPRKLVGLENVIDMNTSDMTENRVSRSGFKKQYEILRNLFSDEEHPQAEFILYPGHQPLPYSVPEIGKQYATLTCDILHPLSRGTVHIASADPLVPPAIDPRYFENEIDLEQLARVVDLALTVYHTSPFKEHVKSIKVPSEDVRGRGLEGLKEYIRENCGSFYHPIGTAAMLPRSDGGVVDSSLQVYGTKNLRIVDLSILPLGVCSHTLTVAYAIGEKGADIIKMGQV
ncbi:alcohol oxidase [Dendrothele bispora CBS 962.96]|uniref:Alcohol oxidase n=1 Tax=Dendrothele bispora (strain CBS 962.96) TaxID=1314807 RepID=A0A4S8LW45_DENBC|nr:alcohol oxidase [Dendrothele bispora CBS 962.96]